MGEHKGNTVAGALPKNTVCCDLFGEKQGWVCLVCEPLAPEVGPRVGLGVGSCKCLGKANQTQFSRKLPKPQVSLIVPNTHRIVCLVWASFDVGLGLCVGMVWENT